MNAIEQATNALTQIAAIASYTPMQEGTQTAGEMGRVLAIAEGAIAMLAAAPAAPAPVTLEEQITSTPPWDELDAILTQNEKDAERYRKMRSLLSTSDLNYYLLEGQPEAEIDEHIDAAIAASKGGAACKWGPIGCEYPACDCKGGAA
jgi:hypothetical protein